MDQTERLTQSITLGTYLSPDHLCPDLLRYENIGEADGWRGRMVRAFFYVMRAWPVEKRDANHPEGCK